MLQECWRVSRRVYLTWDAAMAHVHARCATHPPLLRSSIHDPMLLVNSLNRCCAASQISSSQVRAHGAKLSCLHATPGCLTTLLYANLSPVPDNSHPATHAHIDLLGSPSLYCASLPLLALNTVDAQTCSSLLIASYDSQCYDAYI